MIARSLWATVVAAGAGVARVRLICAEDIEGGSDRRALEPDRFQGLVTDRLPADELSLPRGASPDAGAKLGAALERVGQALRVQMWDKAKPGFARTQSE